MSAGSRVFSLSQTGMAILKLWNPEGAYAT